MASSTQHSGTQLGELIASIDAKGSAPEVCCSAECNLQIMSLLNCAYSRGLETFRPTTEAAHGANNHAVQIICSSWTAMQVSAVCHRRSP